MHRGQKGLNVGCAVPSVKEFNAGSKPLIVGAMDGDKMCSSSIWMPHYSLLQGLLETVKRHITDHT